MLALHGWAGWQVHVERVALHAGFPAVLRGEGGVSVDWQLTVPSPSPSPRCTDSAQRLRNLLPGVRRSTQIIAIHPAQEEEDQAQGRSLRRCWRRLNVRRAVDQGCGTEARCRGRQAEEVAEAKREGGEEAGGKEEEGRREVELSRVECQSKQDVRALASLNPLLPRSLLSLSACLSWRPWPDWKRQCSRRGEAARRFAIW